MQMIILLVLCVECIFLAVMAHTKKLTKKAFVGISLATFLCCGLALILSNSGYSSEKKEKQEENIYMAARLVQEEKIEQAQNLLGKAIDSEYEKYKIQNLRGVIFELLGAYDVTLIYLEDTEDETAQQICQAARKKQPVENSVIQDVTEQTIEELGLQEEVIEKLEAQLQLQYLTEYEETEEEEEDQIPEKESRQNRFEEVAQGAQKGDLEDVIEISNLYVSNYTLDTLDAKDEGYDALLEEATRVQVRLNRAALELSESDTENIPITEEIIISDEQKEYDSILAEYNIILDEMSQERVRRAINYLEANKPRAHEKNVAYQMQMAILHFQAADKESAKKCLDNIFNVESIDRGQWLGLDCFLLRESYLLSMSSGNSEEFEMLFNQAMENLGQGGRNDFLGFFKEYLNELFRGLVIGKIDVSNYPEVAVEVSVSEEDLVLKKDIITVHDTEEMIKDIEISEQEVSDMTICFVLDRSGSMAGSNIKDSKKAIRENVLTLGEEVEVALVSFDNNAVLECGLTKSKYAVSAAVDKIQDQGGTDIAAGLQCANEVLAFANGAKIVILLSDGYDGSADRIDSVLAYSKANGIKVFTIGLEGCDENYLKHIAESTGGTFIPANRTNKLTQIYEEINNYISYTYLLKYEVENTETDFRNFHIRMKDSMIQAKKDYRVNEQEMEENTVQNSSEQIQMSNFYRQTGAAIGGGVNE